MNLESSPSLNLAPQPWLDRPEWKAKKITCSSGVTAIAVVIVALFWNGFSIPVTVIAVPDIWRQGEYVGLFILIFPLIGLLLLAGALHSVLHWFKFGTSVFELETLPARPRGRLKGSIVTKQPLGEGAIVKLSLICQKRLTTGSGKSRSTSVTTLHETKSELRGGLIPSSSGGVRIPVSLEVPNTEISSSSPHSNPAFIWKLKAEASLPGVDYMSEFEVPVFVE